MITFNSNLKSRFNRFALFSIVLLALGFGQKVNAQCTLACQGSVNISIDRDCIDTLDFSFFLKGFVDCVGPFDVSAINMSNNQPLALYKDAGYDQIIVTGAHVGSNLKVTVRDRSSGNTCWSFAKVEDKLPPILTGGCRDTILSCSKGIPSAASLLPDFTDCSLVTWTYFDVKTDYNCSDEYSYMVERTYTLTDAYGSITTCTRKILFKREAFRFDLVSDTEGFPRDAQVDCIVNFATVPSSDGYRHPSPTVTGAPRIAGVSMYPNGAGFCEMNSTFSDQVIPICGTNVYKIVRTWTVADWCTGAVYTRIQLIKVGDFAYPVITCPKDMTISTTSNTCYANVILPAPNVATNCNSSFEVVFSTTNGNPLNGTLMSYAFPDNNIVTNLPIGVTTVTYVAENKCNGLKDTCSYNIVVRDEIVPTVVCDELTRVALSNDGTALVDAYSFDNGSHDNCQIYDYTARRLQGCSGPLKTDTLLNPFSKFIKFTCCDVGKTLMVEMRVRDVSGNSNSCMVQVIVEDKLNPVVICPPNVTVNCGAYPFSTSSGSNTFFDTYFGKIDTKTNKRDSIFVNVAYDGTSNPVFVGFDGKATDNCSVTLDQVITRDLNNCNVGTIKREFTATDNGGRKSTCTQVITVVNERPFYIAADSKTSTGDPFKKNDGIDSHPKDDIVWPDDFVEITTCTSNGEIDTTISGRPRVNDDVCALVAMTYEDLVLPIQAPACYKIIRKWTVIDWCQYNTSAYSGIWTYNQVLKVSNLTAPTIETGCVDTTICLYPTSCKPTAASLSITAKDDCTPISNLKYSWKLDFNYDGTFDLAGTGSTANFNTTTNNYVPFGKHRITWLVEDGCGNLTTCSKFVTLKDCKKPSPICLNGLSADLMPTLGMVTIEAIKFNHGSFDNCTTNLKYRLARPSQYPTNRPDTLPLAQTFTCDDLGAQIVALWVGDDDGNWDYCETFIWIQNNMGAPCNTSNTAAITGTIKNESGEDIESVNVKLMSANISNLTGPNGNFNFMNLATGKNYMVTPVKDMNPTNGVSTNDLVLMNKHILGVEFLNSPYKMIAADINKDGKVSTADMVELRKLILGVNSDFISNKSWRFIDANYQFPNPTNPFVELFPEEKEVKNLSTISNANFVGLKVGDVSGNAKTNSLLGADDRSGNGTFTVATTDKQFTNGEVFDVVMTANQMKQIQGLQYTIDFDRSKLEFVDIKAGDLDRMDINNFGLTMVDNGIITSSWNENNPKEDATLVTLTFKAKSNGQLSKALNISSKYTVAEAYSVNGDQLDIALSFNGKVNNGFELYQNQPNPFQGSTLIGFNLPSASTATLTIYDMAGKVLKVVKGNYTKGYNEINISGAELNNTGVMYYQLDTPTATATKKMIVLE
ncbi:MAG: T9SS type A sorting domain-containing protein [Saprospiraceae bacterium]|nr:T9SS type A sorting domain-containing protein [Saprospiraceae bacterium]